MTPLNKSFTAMDYIAIDIANQFGEVPIDRVRYDMLTMQIDKLNQQILEIQNAESVQQVPENTTN